MAVISTIIHVGCVIIIFPPSPFSLDSLLPSLSLENLEKGLKRADQSKNPKIPFYRVEIRRERVTRSLARVKRKIFRISNQSWNSVVRHRQPARGFQSATIHQSSNLLVFHDLPLISPPPPFPRYLPPPLFSPPAPATAAIFTAFLPSPSLNFYAGKRKCIMQTRTAARCPQLSIAFIDLIFFLNGRKMERIHKHTLLRIIFTIIRSYDFIEDNQIMKDNNK